MPRIFDNIDQQLLPTLKTTLSVSHRSDFCVGYFNLRGWRQLDEHIENWAGGEGECCRLLVGMQTLPQQEIAEAYGIIKQDAELDNQTALRLKKALAEQFRVQLTLGAPTNADEAGLRRLATQIRGKKVIVKLHLRHPLHAKLYLLFRHDPVSPAIGFLGSSNLTFAGLSKQGELNVDVTDHDACEKLSKWFDERWSDKWCLDISQEIADIIDQSWARPEPIPPHHIYVKMAYHLSQEARDGIIRYGIPKDFGNQLFEFQEKAVQIAAHHVHKRGGVLLADVVGLGKTLMATALARVLADELLLETLILCPLNLEQMWKDYCHDYRVPSCRVLPYSKVLQQLPEMRAYRLVILDESHNLRNREGKTYKAILEYIQRSGSKCILLSATPFNKEYLDLASQLRLFVSPDKELEIGPERLLHDVDRAQFRGRYQCGANTLAAFEKSQYPDDWRDLMRLYMVRRTRGFIKANYAKTDPESGRKYLQFNDGTYTVEQIAAKVGKTPVYITSRLKLTDLCDAVAAAFYRSDIGVGHALLLAKLPADVQEQGLTACFKEVYTNNADKPARILLPVRNLRFWIETNVLLLLKDAPFDKRNAELVAAAGSCVDCPSRTGHNKLLFADLGKQDACTNPSCYQAKVNAHVAATVAAKPKLVQISTFHGQQREGSPVLPRNQYVAIREDKPADKDQAKSPVFKTCKYTTEAIIAEGEGLGTFQKVCANPECPVHHPKGKSRPHNVADNAKWKAEQDTQCREEAVSNTTGIRVLAAIGDAVPVRLIKRDLLFVVERLAGMLDENRLAILAKQHGIRKAKDSDSITKLFATFFRRAEESVLGRLAVELTIVFAASRGNAPAVLKEAAAVYKVDTDAIAAKVRQEFAAKEKAKSAKKAPAKAAPAKLKKTA